MNLSNHSKFHLLILSLNTRKPSCFPFFGRLCFHLFIWPSLFSAQSQGSKRQSICGFRHNDLHFNHWRLRSPAISTAENGTNEGLVMRDEDSDGK
ncbi:hypothetical protein V6N12_051260 [Hibiscus sabdariffa]|uniref:Uncharacterized protein n=1 Tax=Hibiscus sabdariffa TaxID=183260 RepID=A0ABR2GFW6_9ROSI